MRMLQALLRRCLCNPRHHHPLEARTSTNETSSLAPSGAMRRSPPGPRARRRRASASRRHRRSSLRRLVRNPADRPRSRPVSPPPPKKPPQPRQRIRAGLRVPTSRRTPSRCQRNLLHRICQSPEMPKNRLHPPTVVLETSGARFSSTGLLSIKQRSMADSCQGIRPGELESASNWVTLWLRTPRSSSRC